MTMTAKWMIYPQTAAVCVLTGGWGAGGQSRGFELKQAKLRHSTVTQRDTDDCECVCLCLYVLVCTWQETEARHLHTHTYIQKGMLVVQFSHQCRFNKSQQATSTTPCIAHWHPVILGRLEFWLFSEHTKQGKKKHDRLDLAVLGSLMYILYI